MILFTKVVKMSDRFKFRVWNKNTHSFTTGGAIKFGGLCFVDEEDFGIKLGEHQECYIIEQCTGLKDKNGNLIYEGDIIKDRFGRKFKVVWSQKDVMFDGRIIIYDPEYSDRYDFYEGATDDVEIIGNIHETKGGKDE